MRNVVAFYVFCALSGGDDELRRRMQRPLDSDLELGLRCLSVLSPVISNEHELAPPFRLAKSLVRWASESICGMIDSAIELIRTAERDARHFFERRCRFAAIERSSASW